MAGFWNKIFNRKTNPDNEILHHSGLVFRGGRYISKDTAMTVAAFFRGQNYLASQLAKLPWSIRNRRREIIEDNIWYLLNVKPNRETTHFAFKYAMISNAIIHGNSYAEIERNGAGQPIALWPLDSKAMDVKRDDYGYLVYEYTMFGRNETKVVLDPSDVLHFRNMHTSDGLMGEGIIQYARRTLGIASGADRMAENMFNNSGIPSGILKHKNKLSDEAYKRLKDSWNSQHGGDKSGGIALLEEGLEFEGLNMDPDVLQFLESRKFSVEEMSRFLGIPPHKLYDMTKATYSNAEQANMEVATDTLDPWACSLEAEVDVKLLNGQYGGKYSEIEVSEIFRADSNTRATYFTKLMGVGAITPNEIRRKEGYPDYAEGNKFYIAVNNFTPADKVDDVIQSQIDKNNRTGAPADSTDDTEDEETRAANATLARALADKFQRE